MQQLFYLQYYYIQQMIKHLFLNSQIFLLNLNLDVNHKRNHNPMIQFTLFHKQLLLYKYKDHVLII